ncbi:dihydrodipicolinate synthase family protein [Georgenia sp. H159]|uniref:dihydrodipicolinate synthase family protein n=1 Tax=Georgenia sp. H159 TaxID=3076115 RepID=UPI002D78D7D9|nr:dihydrodipicolinate synthase family protein [Georgenia sp. H159]
MSPAPRELLLPDSRGARSSYQLREPGPWRRPQARLTARVAYAAAHVVPAVWADNSPEAPAQIDWDSTLAFRHYLWSYGLGVAEAMDTAQRGMGLDWPATVELIRRSSAEARSAGGAIAAGAGTDQLDLTTLPDDRRRALATVLDAYREQLFVVLDAGAQPILMASRALAAVARGAEDYQHVYETLLAEVPGPVILHWLGVDFDPALSGYWGSEDLDAAAETFLRLLHSRPEQVDGVKVSLLDADREIALRARMPQGVRMYTGDDFNYPDLVVGDERGHSDALLGVFAAIAPAASTALQELERPGGAVRAREILETTRPLGEHLFAAPTYYYKAGVAFLAWLNGQQPGYQLVAGLHAGRSLPHLVQLFRLADQAGLLLDPDLAATRMGQYLAVAGADSLPTR